MEQKENQDLQLSQKANMIQFRNQVTWSDDCFGVCINSVLFKIGISTPIDVKDPLGRLEMDSIYNFVSRQFPEFTIKAIDLAFEAYAGGKLIFWVYGKPQDNIWDKQFDHVFICKVLNSYRKYRTTLRKLNMDKKIEAPKSIPVLTFDEIKHNKDLAFKMFINNEKFEDVNWTQIYDYLIENKEIIEQEKDEKIMYAAKVKADLQQEIQQLKYEKKNTYHKEMSLSSKMFLACECYKRIVLDYFELEKNR